MQDDFGVSDALCRAVAARLACQVRQPSPVLRQTWQCSVTLRPSCAPASLHAPLHAMVSKSRLWQRMCAMLRA